MYELSDLFEIDIFSSIGSDFEPIYRFKSNSNYNCKTKK